MSGTITGLSLTDVVNVQVALQPKAAPTRNFGALLVVGSSPVIDTQQRIRQYSTLDEVLADFGTTTPEYYAADLFFSQNPQPAILYIGRWAQTATAGLLRGGVLNATQQLIAPFNAVTAGGFDVTIDGTVKTITGLSFADATNLNAVASAVTTALGAAGTMLWNGQQFVITSATTGINSTVTPLSAPASGVDVSAMLGGTTATGAVAVNGIVAETAVACAALMADLSNNWYGLQFAAVGMVTADHQAIAALVEGLNPPHIYGLTSQDGNCLSSTSTTDVAYVLASLKYNRTFVQYSGSSPYAVAAMYGRAFTVDFTGNNTTITLKFKQEPGVAPEFLSESQAQALVAKNCNVFVEFNTGQAIIKEGTMASGAFFDEIHNIDWQQNYTQIAVWNLLYTTPTKIPQTDQGIHQIQTVVNQSLQQGVTNGFLGPGVWGGPPIGTLNTGDTLSAGYYSYYVPLAQQSAADRAARKAPLIQCALHQAGAVHFANVSLTLD